jgi:hypothetical protein
MTLQIWKKLNLLAGTKFRQLFANVFSLFLLQVGTEKQQAICPVLVVMM